MRTCLFSFQPSLPETLHLHCSIINACILSAIHTFPAIFISVMFFSPLLLTLPDYIIFFLIYYLGFCLRGSCIQHICQHAVVFFIKHRITHYVSAKVLFTDVKAFHHLTIQQTISLKLQLREIFSPQLFNLLLLCLGKMSCLSL